MNLEKIIEEAQSGNEKAKHALIKLMLDNGYMKRINKYLHKNRLLNPQDVESDFWLGVTKAIAKVRFRLSENDQGNDPLQYLAYKGLCQVKTSLRRAIQKGVIVRCNDCGHESKIKNKEGSCQKCGSQETETFQFENLVQHYEKVVDMVSTNGQDTDAMHHRDKLQQIREILSPRQQTVLDLWIKALSSRESVNYMREIGQEMHITPQCVKIYIDRIKQKAREITNES